MWIAVDVVLFLLWGILWWKMSTYQKQTNLWLGSHMSHVTDQSRHLR